MSQPESAEDERRRIYGPMIELDGLDSAFQLRGAWNDEATLLHLPCGNPVGYFGVQASPDKIIAEADAHWCQAMSRGAGSE